MIPPLPRANATNLLLIRLCLLAGLLVMGAAIWFIRRNPDALILEPDRARSFGWAFIALAVVALAGMFVMRKRLERGGDPQAMLQTYMVGYAMAEGAALFAAVTWYMGGNPNWYVAGVLLMASAFQILPINRGET